MTSRTLSPSPSLQRRVMAWYDENARDLPWRRAGTTPWGVLVSEVMSQQTPVARVAPAWQRWVERWPAPADLAAASPAVVLRAWDRLGYPRRALRLQECARAIVANHDGVVPSDEESLLALPGIGPYTAAAVVAFAHRGRSVVLDTNIRRVLTRVLDGEAHPPAHVRASERVRAEELLPEADPARWNVAAMELGALVCTAREPRCPECPIASVCAWRLAGRPESPTPRRTQAWAGTDRQMRGRIMRRLRDLGEGEGIEPGVLIAEGTAHATDPDQPRRALESLLGDGLAELTETGRIRLPR